MKKWLKSLNRNQIIMIILIIVFIIGIILRWDWIKPQLKEAFSFPEKTKITEEPIGPSVPPLIR